MEHPGAAVKVGLEGTLFQTQGARLEESVTTEVSMASKSFLAQTQKAKVTF